MTSITERDQFLSLENFVLAWKIIRNSDRLEIKDRLALEIYAANRDKHLELLITSLRNNSYMPESCEFVFATKADGTLRPFTYLTMQDRLVYQALGNIVLKNSYRELTGFANNTLFAHIPRPPNKDEKFSPYVFEPAFPQNGTGQFEKYKRKIIKEMETCHQLGYGWLIKTDIASYYPSIDHQLLVSLLSIKGWLTDDQLLQLLERMLRTWSSSFSMFSIRQGIPIGYETSDLIGTLLLIPIDQVLNNDYRTALRYVDDFHIFVEREDHVVQTLLEFDLLLQKYALIRNSSKTEIVECTKQSINVREIEFKLLKQLSGLQRRLNGDNQDQRNAQEEIHHELHIEYEDSWLEHREHLKPVEQWISFVLYRLEAVDTIARNIALRLLQWFPHRTINAITYLKKYIDQPEVKDAIFNVAQTSIYPEARIHCLNILIESYGYSSLLVNLLVDWSTNEADWQLRYEAVSRLGSMPSSNYDFIRNTSQTDYNLFVRAKALLCSFEHAPDSNSQIEIINDALGGRNSYLHVLGLYLWRRQLDIPRIALNLHLLPDGYEKLYLDEIEVDSAHRLRKTLHDLFSIDIDPNLPLYEMFEDITAASQQILDVLDAETNMQQTCLRLYEFMTSVLVFSEVGVVTTQGRTTLESILNNIAEPYIDGISRLIGYVQTISNGARISPAYRNSLLADITPILQHSLEKIHSRYGLQMPTVPQLATDSRPEIFISYSHKDIYWLNKFKVMFKPAERNYILEIWEDTKLKVGNQWHDDIQAALKRAKIAILLVTPDFLYSDYIHQHELAPILKSAKDEGLKIVWVAVRFSQYKQTELKHYQCANIPDRPLESFIGAQRNRAVSEIVDKVLEIIAQESDET